MPSIYDLSSSTSLITRSLLQVLIICMAHLWQAIDLKQNQDKNPSTGALDLHVYPHRVLLPAIGKTIGSTGDYQDRIFQAIIGSGGLGDDVIKQLWPSASYAVVQGLGIAAGCRWSHVALPRPSKNVGTPICLISCICQVQTNLSYKIGMTFG